MTNITLLLPNGKQEAHSLHPRATGRTLYYVAAEAYGIGGNNSWKLSLRCGGQEVPMMTLCSQYMGEGAVVTVTEK